MTAQEIFKKILDRKMAGVNYHRQLIEYYKFLGMDSYSKMHKKRAVKEFKEYMCVHCKYTDITDCIVPVDACDYKQVIPESWYKYKRQDVSSSEKRSAVKKGFDDWIVWEKTTKEMLMRCYHELKEIDQFSLADTVCKMIVDEDHEIMEAEKMKADLQDMDYSMFAMKE